MPPGQAHLLGLRAVVNQAEQHQQLGPGSVALVHGVWKQGGVLPQALVQSHEGVVALEGLVFRQHVPLFGVEQEHEPQVHGQQCVVDAVGIIREGLPQQLSLRGVLRRLESPQHLVQGVEHLLGEALADLVLEPAAVIEQGRQPLRGGQGQQPALLQEQPHRGTDRPAGGLHHLRHAKVHPAGAFPPRRRDQPDGKAVEQQAGLYFGAPEKPFHPAVRRGFEGAGPSHLLVEGLTRFQDPDEELPVGLPFAGVPLPDGEVWSKGFPIRRGNLEFVRDGVVCAAGVALGREVPFQDGPREGLEIRQPRFWLAVLSGPFLDAVAQPPLPFGVLPVEDGPGSHQCRRGDHEAARLDEADPLEVPELSGGPVWPCSVGIRPQVGEADRLHAGCPHLVELAHAGRFHFKVLLELFEPTAPSPACLSRLAASPPG